MKSWQGGYPLEQLLALEALYEGFNRYSLSPFSAMKKHKFAVPLKTGKLHVDYDDEGPRWAYEAHPVKVPSVIYAYPRVALGKKEKDDVVIKNVAWRDRPAQRDLLDELSRYQQHMWLYGWAEDGDWQEMARSLNGTSLLPGKVSSFAEIVSIHEVPHRVDAYRMVPDPLESASFVKTGLYCEASLVSKVLEKVPNEGRFADHYSNYNKRHSWKALALRGYFDDPAHIEKPAEMSKTWKKNNPGWEQFGVHDTELYERFPEVRTLIAKNIPTAEVHRVRFMSLGACGELTRHADIVDIESGVDDEGLARLHIPLMTNPDVRFFSWDGLGRKQEVHMAPGTCWYLDTRKPHAAKNQSLSPRLHLVIDVRSGPRLREWLGKGDFYG